MTDNQRFGGRSSSTPPDGQPEPAPVPGLPDLWWTNNSCAICGATTVEHAHLIDQSRRTFLKLGKSETLPHYWALCARCEDLYQSGEDSTSIELMAGHRGEDETSAPEVGRSFGEVLAAFRAAETGRVDKPR